MVLEVTAGILTQLKASGNPSRLGVSGDRDATSKEKRWRRGFYCIPYTGILKLPVAMDVSVTTWRNRNASVRICVNLWLPGSFKLGRGVDTPKSA